MSRSKKIFAAFAFLFVLFLVFVVYDISSRTTFPGARPSNESRPATPGDTIPADSIGAYILPLQDNQKRLPLVLHFYPSFLRSGDSIIEETTCFPILV